MNISPQGLSLIKSFEGLRLDAYRDSVGIWTIGYGCIKYPDGTQVKAADCCTNEQAEAFLKADVQRFVDGLNKRLIGIVLKQNQFDALVSFCYNLGLGSFDESQLYKKLKENPNDISIFKYNSAAPERSCEFLRWINAGGKVVPGLVRRRMVEADYYSS